MEDAERGTDVKELTLLGAIREYRSLVRDLKDAVYGEKPKLDSDKSKVAGTPLSDKITRAKNMIVKNNSELAELITKLRKIGS